MDLSHRSDLPETMDDDGLDPAVYARCLSELATVNILTLTHHPTLRWLRHVTADLPRGSVVRILDVACGHGDLLRAIDRWGRKSGLVLALEGIDLNPRSAAVAAAATPPGMTIAWRTGDVFDYTPDPPPDLIVSSQFAHHLPDPAVVRFLQWLDAHAARGWFIADLQRHVLAYWGFRVLATLAGWHRIVREDGAISVARSFRRADWRRLLAAAGIPGTVRWALPFRLCVARRK